MEVLMLPAKWQGKFYFIQLWNPESSHMCEGKV